MKRLYLILALLLLLAGCTTQKGDRLMLTDWSLEYNDELYPATVPGFVHTDLMAHGIIADPYYGTNEDSVQWIGERSWCYSTTVDFKDLPAGDSLWLVFEGIAGRATIALTYNFEEGTTPMLDGEVLEHADNMFVEYWFPIDRFDSCESVTIEVIFNLEHGEGDSIAEAEYGITLPDRRAFTRIAPYQQGWDWGPRLKSFGIWKPVYITPRETRNTSRTSETRNTRVDLRQERDSIGQSFTFYKDGEPLFVKGANWIPVHSFPVDDEANRARYRLLLSSAKEAGFNMLRVWGGGIYEHDYFFDLCDSLGLMVWMDFNFSCTLYPDNPEMLESIREEARQNIRRIARHPCVVLWCGNNEVKNGWEDWGWQGAYHWTPEQRARLEKAMDTIFGYSSATSNSSSTSILAQAVRECDPLGRPYIVSSPLFGWGHPECVTHGDSHYWGVWWGEEPFEKYAEKTGRFMSEFGFQSYPDYSTLVRICPPDQLYIDSPTLRSHQKHPRGREIIDKAMRRYYGFDSKSLSLEDYCYVSQLLQAWGVGYGIFQHLKQQPHCMGTLYWQLNDCWPVASWSSIDYFGNWKALHYFVHDLYNEYYDLEVWEKYFSVYPKDRIYPKPKYTFSVEFDKSRSLKNSPIMVTITAETDLYEVMLQTNPHVDGHFSSNYFELRAGETHRSFFIPNDPKADLSGVKVTVRTLNELYNIIK